MTDYSKFYAFREKMKEQHARKQHKIKPKRDIVHVGDLLFYLDTLIRCDEKLGDGLWRFSGPYVKDFTMTLLEVLLQCRK